MELSHSSLGDLEMGARSALDLSSSECPSVSSFLNGTCSGTQVSRGGGGGAGLQSPSSRGWRCISHPECVALGVDCTPFLQH